MSVALYDVSVPLFTQLLGSLSGVLDKAAAFASAKKVDPGVLMQSRLAPDMFPLMRQIQMATDMSKGAVARLSGTQAPVYADEETTIDDAKARIAKTVEFIKSVPAEQINAAAGKPIAFEIGPKDNRRELKFPNGAGFLTYWVIPNFTFHCTTAYDILRHSGVDLGKRDFLGAMQ